MTAKAPSAGHELHTQIEAARVLLASYPDIMGDDAKARADAVEGETTLHEAIALGLSRIMEIEILETGIREAMDNLKARASRLGEQKKNLRTSLCVAMELAELPKMETPVGTVSLKRVPPDLEIVDESAIPARFFKPQEPKLDRMGLKAALKANEVIPGARLDNGTLSVQISGR